MCEETGGRLSKHTKTLPAHLQTLLNRSEPNCCFSHAGMVVVSRATALRQEARPLTDSQQGVFCRFG